MYVPNNIKQTALHYYTVATFV